MALTARAPRRSRRAAADSLGTARHCQCFIDVPPLQQYHEATASCTVVPAVLAAEFQISQLQVSGRGSASGGHQQYQTLHPTATVESKQDARSYVWQYFGQIVDDSGKTVNADHVYCTVCFDKGCLKGYKNTVSTTNVSQHLGDSHGILYAWH